MTQAPDTTLTVADPRQVQRVEAPAAPPTIEHILMAAVQRGDVDPDALEKLVALKERVERQQAEKAFNAAMTNFKGECPAILKVKTASIRTKSGGEASYRFAPLEEVTKIVDPVLHRHGLTYHFDSKMDGRFTTVTCHVHHVDGHSRASTFSCEGGGSPLMNSAQVSASAVTFASRYALLLALGVTTDADDDGRRAVPSPAPPPDPDAPKVPTRDERNAPRVSVATLNGLFARWQEKLGGAGGTAADFFSWCKVTLGTDCDLSKVSEWDTDSVDVVREAMQ